MKVIIAFLLLPSLWAKTLILDVENLSDSFGEIAIAVFDEQNRSFFPNQDEQAIYRSFYLRQEFPIKIDLPYGHYAISVFEDVNDSGDLDTNFFGVPKEPFGFSKNPVIRLGPPNFEQAKIIFSKSDQFFRIRLNR